MMARRMEDNEYVVFGCKSGKNGWFCPHNRQFYNMFQKEKPESLTKPIRDLQKFEKINGKILDDIISSMRNDDLRQKFENAKQHLIDEGLVRKKI